MMTSAASGSSARRSRGIGCGLGIAEIDEHGGAAGGRLDVLLRSPTMKLARSTPSSAPPPGSCPVSACGSCARPCRWKQALTASTGSSRVMVSCIASTSDREIKPLPTSGWFVITANEAPPLQPLETGRGFGVLEILQPPWGEAAPVAEFGNDDHPIPIRNTAGPARGHGLPFRLPALQGRMADEAVPNHGLKGLRQRGDPGRIDLRDHHHHVAVLGGVAAVPADDPEHFRRTRLARSTALTMLGLILRSSSPPPTE